MTTTRHSSGPAPSQLASVCVLTAVCAAFGLFRLALDRAVATPSNAAAPSVGSATPAGVKAAYELMRAEGYRVGTWNAGFSKLHQSTAAVLLVTLPIQQPITMQEEQDLSRWVRNGGTLVAFLSRRGSAALLASMPAGLQLAAGAGYDSGGPVRPVIDTFRFGPLAPASASRLELSPHSAWTPIYVDTGGVLVATARSGKGRTMAVADGGIISNRTIAEANNAVLLVSSGRVLNYTRTSRILFDEYHHQSGRTSPLPEVGMWRLAPPWLKYLAVALVVLGLFSLASAQFCIPPVGAVTPRAEGAATDYLEELARWYQRCHAQAWALSALNAYYFQQNPASGGSAADEPQIGLLEHARMLHTRWKKGTDA
ncbi:MAG: DUF4350 domain-containing protein [Armatimonadetes bacterium]|nr:DUF4350 domain-containing protein [Armatimonadota bacterium]MDE2206020.1 DUF4350 domain-containing protein [Armatimonadota bacterium]